MRRFHLVRTEDKTGVSGTGVVAEGVQFTHGKVVITWVTKYTSLAVYDSLAELIMIHGHDGSTTVVWLDETAIS